MLLICGHPRSGTTLLQRLCDAHPEMAVTNEFGNLSFLGDSYWQYTRHIFDRWQRVRDKWAFDFSYAHEQERLSRRNFQFMLRHLYQLRRNYTGSVTIDAMEKTQFDLFPNAKVVGDKWPHYLFRLDKFSKMPLTRLIIYRDCRDVTSSFLKQARTTWKAQEWVEKVNTAEKIAARWVKGIEMMEAYAADSIILQYEALMRDPVTQLTQLSTAIGIDPAGFPTEMIKPTSIGNYKKGLTDEEIESVQAIAGSTMARLGYL